MPNLRITAPTFRQPSTFAPLSVDGCPFEAPYVHICTPFRGRMPLRGTLRPHLHPFPWTNAPSRHICTPFRGRMPLRVSHSAPRSAISGAKLPIAATPHSAQKASETTLHPFIIRTYPFLFPTPHPLFLLQYCL